MKFDVSCLLQQIETMRKNLINLGNSKSLSDPDVIELSQRLDQLLNEYYKLHYISLLSSQEIKGTSKKKQKARSV